MKKSRSLPIAVLVLVAGALIVSGYRDKKVETFHSYEEIRAFQQMDGELTDLENELFTGSGKCAGCHGHDIAELGNITESGWDVNPTDYWRSSIMANSAKDPFWRAKVTHEVAVNPEHQLELEDKCTSCHAPLGHFNAHYLGAQHYTYAQMLSDTVALDGVSCAACHQQSPVGIGNSFSGELTFVQDTIYGPFGGGKDENPIVGQPMASFVGFEPVFGEHITESEVCAGCHTLITGTADLDGNATGQTFVEQATYHEWLNSIYAENGVNNAECQACHMPELDEEVIISANYAWLEPRGPIGLHYMVGANTFMVEMMKNNIEFLGLSATEAQFDTTLMKTFEMLQEESVEILLEEGVYDEDSVSFTVTLDNLVGHKFPSGYPARRSYIEFIVSDDMGNELFHSGELQADYEVFGQDETFEPHYDLITEEEQVQIYEQVLGDVNGDVTTVLERAATHLKDNRLVPKGFSFTHEVYDTTEVAGFALADPNFNYIGGEEGSGTDEITYKVALDGYEGVLIVSAKLWYQAAPPKWMEEMFSFSTPEIETFQALYEEQGAAPVLVDEQEITLTIDNVEEFLADQVTIYPNPSTDGIVTVELASALVTSNPTYVIYASNGQLVGQGQLNGNRTVLEIPGAEGSYLISIESGEYRLTERILKLRP
ncbi:MAG: T9SS type A sorting domain-containing protein [Flavobacteriales bacterium]|nr:T9SS type A sorting domain-containing protein [Flavobacteriales bacterium]